MSVRFTLWILQDVWTDEKMDLVSSFLIKLGQDWFKSGLKIGLILF